MKRGFKLIILAAAFFISHIPISSAEVYEASRVPWSGYWWPYRIGGLLTGDDYNGKPSPVSKYDYATQGTYKGEAYFYGLKYFYDPNALDWEGLCFSWAVASALESEPVKSGVYGGELFYVGDKKALLTAAYHRVVYLSYPVHTPELFHEVLDTFIATEQSVVVIDLHTNNEVWNYPVFKFETNYETVGDTRHYTTEIYYPRNAVDPDFVGSSITSKVYWYYFTLGAGGEIVDSGWENDSVDDYPNKAYQPFSADSENNEIKYDIVQEIINAEDDSFEPNDSLESAKSVSSGSHQLIFENDDFFKVFLKKGDVATVKVDCDDETLLNITAYDTAGKIIEQEVCPAKFYIEGTVEGDYVIEMSGADDDTSIPYMLNIEQRLAFLGIFPVDLTGSWVNGIALMNPKDDEDGLGRLIVSSVSSEGVFKDSYTVSESRDKIAGTLEFSMGLPSTDNGYVRIDSDKELKGLQVVCASNNKMIGTNLVDTSQMISEEIIFPLLTSAQQITTNIGLINTGSEKKDVEVQSFDSNGDVVLENAFEIGPGEKIEDTNFDVITSLAQAIKFIDTSGGEGLIGYLSLESTRFNVNGRAIVALPKKAGQAVVAPHVAIGGNWDTLVAVMNAGTIETAVDCRAYERNGEEIAYRRETLKPYQAICDTVGSFFSSDRENISSVVFKAENDVDLTGFSIFTTSAHERIIGAPLSEKRDEGAIFIPHIAVSSIWNTGLAIMNAEEVAQEVSLCIYNENGVLIEKESNVMAPFQSMSLALKNIFANATQGSFATIDSDVKNGGGLCGFYTIGRADGTAMMGDLIH